MLNVNHKSHRIAGFTLLEALVALVVLSFVFTSVWDWFGTALRTTSRIEESVALPHVFEQYLDYMSLESLKDEVSGKVQIDDFIFHWQATVNRQSDQEIFRRQPNRVVTLFDLHVRIFQGERFVDDISTQLVRHWRDPND